MKQNDNIDIMSKRCWREGKVPRAADWRGPTQSRKSAKRCKSNVEIAHRRARAIDKQSLIKEIKSYE
jgi:hypothetical protein